MPASNETLNVILEKLVNKGQPVEKIVIYLRQPSDGKQKTSPNNEGDFHDLYTTMVNATDAIARANFDDGLDEKDMDLSKALGAMQDYIIGLSGRRDRESIERMFDTAKEDISDLDFLQSLSDAQARIGVLRTILDIHFALACYQIDNPQPELALTSAN